MGSSMRLGSCEDELIIIPAWVPTVTSYVTIQPVDAFFAGSGGTEPVREYSASALSIVSSG